MIYSHLHMLCRTTTNANEVPLIYWRQLLYVLLYMPCMADLPAPATLTAHLLPGIRSCLSAFHQFHHRLVTPTATSTSKQMKYELACVSPS